CPLHVETHQAADTVNTAYRASRVGVVYFTSIVEAHQGADIVVAGNRGSGQPQVANRSGRARVTEQADDAVNAEEVDGQPVDDVAVAVQAAAESLRRIADRGEASIAPHVAGIA